MSFASAQSLSFVVPVLAYVTLGFAILGYQLKSQQPAKKMVPVRIRSRRPGGSNLR